MATFTVEITNEEYKALVEASVRLNMVKEYVSETDPERYVSGEEVRRLAGVKEAKNIDLSADEL